MMHRSCLRPCLRTFLPLLLLALLLWGPTGCEGPTYVNIPPQSGDTAFHDPNGDDVRAVMATAVHGLLLSENLQKPVAVRLPKGATELTTADVARRAGQGVVSVADQSVQPATTIHVREVRVRGNRAQVDIVVPGRGGVPHLTTVYLSLSAFNGWHAQRTRPWQGSVQQMLPSERMQNAPTTLP